MLRPQSEPQPQPPALVLATAQWGAEDGLTQDLDGLAVALLPEDCVGAPQVGRMK